MNAWMLNLYILSNIREQRFQSGYARGVAAAGEGIMHVAEVDEETRLELSCDGPICQFKQVRV